MASTNKTTNLNLTQFVASDKPAWLTDYNNDMRAIDEAVGAANEAVGAVETAQEELGRQVSAQLQSGGISTYTHAKSGNVHTLTGEGDNIKFVATAEYAAGDTFVVNGAACEAKTTDGNALLDGCFVSGALVSSFYVNSQLYVVVTQSSQATKWLTGVVQSYSAGVSNGTLGYNYNPTLGLLNIHGIVQFSSVTASFGKSVFNFTSVGLPTPKVATSINIVAYVSGNSLTSVASISIDPNGDFKITMGHSFAYNFAAIDFMTHIGSATWNM